jgi:CDP-glycerol glycerophosphotransferase
MEQAMHRAKYWIANHRVPDYIYPGKNQIYVQCWHGTPLKRLGYDLAYLNNAMNSSDEMWTKYRIDASKFKYLISPSAYASEKFASAWNLKAIGKESVLIETGYPRNDFLYTYTQRDCETIRETLGLNSKPDKKVILYAPTWRDNQFESSIGYTYNHALDLDLWKERLGEDYVVLCRFHYFVANQIDFEKHQGFIYNVSDYDDINDLYIISDLLITDYSSVFFDYANLRRPILFYMYDIEDYRDNIRGFYIELDELPGPIVTDDEALLGAIQNTDFSGDIPQKYKEFNARFNYLDDGSASGRVAETVFEPLLKQAAVDTAD